MSNKLYFENVLNIGKLYLEHVFLYFEQEPVLFVCSDNEGKYYLCFCSEMRGFQQWIISLTSVEILEKLIDNKISIYTALKSDDAVAKLKIILDLDNNETCSEIMFGQIDEFELPEKSVNLLYFDEIAAKEFVLDIVKKCTLKNYYISFLESEKSFIHAYMKTNFKQHIFCKSVSKFTYDMNYSYLENVDFAQPHKAYFDFKFKTSVPYNVQMDNNITQKDYTDIFPAA